MTWVAVAIAGSAVIGAGASMYAGDKAADAQKGASNASIAEQRRQYNNSMLMYEPSRQLGYGAQSDIASLYGYSLPAYQNAQQLLGGGGTGNVSGGGGGSGGAPSWANPLNALPGGSLSPLGVFGHKDPLSKGIDSLFGGGGGYNYAGGSVDPRTGTVTVTDSNPEPYNEALTNYLRTGEWTLDPRRTKYVSRVKSEIDKLRGSG